jgi:S-adenosylmethionine hydrolase
VPQRVITLTTDFGSSDHFVGAMKGVILGIQPAAHIVDITHEVQAFEISDGAFTIAQAYRYFPKRTIHVIVVDPGVGSTRRPILAEMAGQFFVAPDNGILSMIFAREKLLRKPKIRHITEQRYFLHPVSRTFHGRDLFAPVAAHLASGVLPARFGKLIDDYIQLTFDRPTKTGKNVWIGSVLKVDRFGNLITNLRVDDFPNLEIRPFRLQVGSQAITRLALTFTDGSANELFVIVGSSGYLEVAANQSSASKMLGCGAGSPVKLTL